MPPLDKAEIGSTGVRVTRVGMGGAPIGGLYTAVEAATAVETIRRAHELGVGYFEKEVRIVTEDGECIALTYYANPDRLDSTIRPLDWYKDYVVRGAREHGLPAHYIRELDRVATSPRIGKT